jgi:hypothetical protein
MKTLPDLIRITQIEGRTWNNVIQVPCPSIVVPIHAAFELSLNVVAKILERTPQKILGS